MSFNEAWGALQPAYKDRFPRLRTFCGDLTTMLPKTAWMKSDLSLMRLEKRASLSDLQTGRSLALEAVYSL
eukprot:scaffold2939_cov406-Prasinococcus_capsulatus_cf.AAC.5